VGFAVIFGELGRTIIVYFWSYYASLHFTVDGLRFVAPADMNPIATVSGLAILVIAEVFQEGSRSRNWGSVSDSPWRTCLC
jgi:hypothetical protein